MSGSNQCAMRPHNVMPAASRGVLLTWRVVVLAFIVYIGAWQSNRNRTKWHMAFFTVWCAALYHNLTELFSS